MKRIKDIACISRPSANIRIKPAIMLLERYCFLNIQRYIIISTEQVPNFVLSENLQKICEHSQKSALNLAEIQHQNGHGDHMGRSLPQLCGVVPCKCSRKIPKNLLN